MKDEWGAWIEHDGKGCPVKGQFVRCVLEGPIGTFKETVGIAGSSGGWSWDWRYFMTVPPGCSVFAMRVVRYQVRKPRSLALLREIAREVEDRSPARVRRKEREVAR